MTNFGTFELVTWNPVSISPFASYCTNLHFLKPRVQGNFVKYSKTNEMQYDLSILFFLKKAQVDKKGLTPIYLRITVNGQRAEISTNRKIEVLKWDSAIQRVKGRSETARILNEDLDSQQNRIRKDYLSLVEKEEYISAEKLKDMLTGKYLKYYYLIDIFEKNNKLVELEIGSKYTKDTFVRYQITIARLKNFLRKEYNITDIKFHNNCNLERRYSSNIP